MSHVFISYAREDRGVARRLYRSLLEHGVLPWIDQENLLPGAKWVTEIEAAIKNSSCCIILLSERSVNKRGFIQREIKYALDILKEIPPGQIFVIPARLDNCAPGYDELKELNWVDLFPDYDAGLKRIVTAFDSRVRSSSNRARFQWLVGQTGELRRLELEILRIVRDSSAGLRRSEIYSRLSGESRPSLARVGQVLARLYDMGFLKRNVRSTESPSSYYYQQSTRGSVELARIGLAGSAEILT